MSTYGPTVSVVREGFAMGAETAVLTSSEIGEGVYKRLGFRERARWAQWLPAEPDPDS
jgi:hypothetical protein